MSAPLRVGYVPEHFSTPLYFARRYHHLAASLTPFPSGTGHMVEALSAGELDVAIGLTEGWVAALGKAQQESRRPAFRLVGTYVETPLCWAISTGARRQFSSVEQLRGAKVGVSRIGSGSHIMSYVLADAHGWLPAPGGAPFDVVPLGTFEKLRAGVNDGSADFFMWEHFTSKRYYDNGDIKRVGEIYTPWSSWKIVASTSVGEGSEELKALLQAVNGGIEYFDAHHDEAVEYISQHLDYSVADAREWLTTVRFPRDVRSVSEDVVDKTVDVLRIAGVLGDAANARDMIGVSR
ncbi:MAG: hypothetical protein M1833_001890 [Piccolia ochrophora]|nr:MAG: hypothetical protein M1833_001890 [Piccolia ochrophora]